MQVHFRPIIQLFTKYKKNKKENFLTQDIET